MQAPAERRHCDPAQDLTSQALREAIARGQYDGGADQDGCTGEEVIHSQQSDQKVRVSVASWNGEENGQSDDVLQHRQTHHHVCLRQGKLRTAGSLVSFGCVIHYPFLVDAILRNKFIGFWCVSIKN